jgi:hypothetical protein
MAPAGDDDMHRHTLIEQHGFMATAQVVKPRTGEAKGGAVALRPNSWVTLRGFCRLVNEMPCAFGRPPPAGLVRIQAVGLYHFSGVASVFDLDCSSAVLTMQRGTHFT